MTLDEKIVLMHGVNAMKGTVETGFEWAAEPNEYVGVVPPIKRLGIPSLRLADGRAGVGNKAKDITLLPAPIAAASSWDTALLNEFGRVLGEEQWGKGTNVELGPSIDVVRVPEWGRTFESYGEDPYFNGEMAAAEIKGIQSQGPIADANMYLTMNQESDRFRADSVVDERTLQEIYLPPFEASVKDGHVGTFMCAYVKTNGVYSCENAHILRDLLKTQLKFDGWVMSDWGATHSTVDCADNGLDQQMPDDTFYGAALKKAVVDGKVSVATIDEHVRRILVPMFRQGLFDKEQPGKWTSNVRSPQHDRFSRSVAEQGTILLKNDGALLPLQPAATIAVIGAAGDKTPKIEGGEAPRSLRRTRSVHWKGFASARVRARRSLCRRQRSGSGSENRRRGAVRNRLCAYRRDRRRRPARPGAAIQAGCIDCRGGRGQQADHRRARYRRTRSDALGRSSRRHY